MYLIFDLETTGLVADTRFAYPHYTDAAKYDPARIVQIAWMLLEDDLDHVVARNFIIARRGEFSIPNSDIHGITDEISDSRGKDLVRVLHLLFRDMRKADYLVAHNLRFDYHVLLHYVYRNGLANMFTRMERMEKYCTMKLAKPILRLPSQYYQGYKNPSLQELHEHYFGSRFDNAHDASADVEATAKCLVQMIKTQ